MDERRDAGGEEAAVEIIPGRPVPPRVLVVDDEEIICKYLRRVLAQRGYEASYVLSGEEALKELGRAPYSILLADVKMPGMTGIELLARTREQFPGVSVVIMTAHGSIETAVDAMKMGASDFLTKKEASDSLAQKGASESLAERGARGLLTKMGASDFVTKPFDGEELALILGKVLEQRKLVDEIARLRRELASRYDFENMISQDAKMREIFATIKRVAATDATVLITGETGTGKELVARALHYNSSRRDRQFVGINCGALPDTLLETELFGYEPGAFTGAVGEKLGIFEVADGGTLLLDEIGNVSPAMQVKLLRVLETMEFKRVGGVQTRRCNVRVVTATHVDLAQATEKGEFRRDLFYRINVVPITLPPLRERVGDIPLLVGHFVERDAPRMNPAVRDVSREALRRLLRYSWPGNVRQLEHVIQRALILADGPVILPNHLPLDEQAERDHGGALAVNEQLPLEEVKNGLIERVERTYLDRVLRLYRGNVRRTARHAGLSERSIYEKLKRYQLDRRSYK